ncbi:MAG: HAMP domain-containing sensor histidine kinase [Myxococcota bacterium]
MPFDPVPCVLVIADPPPDWAASLGPADHVRVVADVIQAIPLLDAGWPDVVAVTQRVVDPLVGHLGRALAIEIVKTPLAARLGPPFTDAIVEPVNAERFWRRVHAHLELAMFREGRDPASQDVASLVHELRNPVHALVGGLEALRRGLPSDLETRSARLIDVLGHSASRLSHLVRAFRPKSERAPCAPWDAAQSIAATLAILEHRHEEVTVGVQTEPGPVVVGHPGELDQVILNLLDNAMRAAGRGGRVDVEVTSEPRFLELRVSDDGPGIPEAMRERVFDPYVTTHRGKGGTGLGLHLCRRIVGRHGGELFVGAGSNGGAQFTLRLPVDPHQEPA